MVKEVLLKKFLYGAFELVKERSGKDPLEVFEAALTNVMPVLEVKSSPCWWF